MGADLAFLLGLDDSEFRSALRNSENEVGRAAGRIGGYIRTQVGGVRNLIGSVTQITGVVGLVAGAVTGLIAAYDQMANAAERARKAAEKEEQTRRETLRTATAQAEVLTSGVLGTEFDAAEVETRLRFAKALSEFPDFQSSLSASGRTRTAEDIAAEERYNELLEARDKALERIARRRRDAIDDVISEQELGYLESQGRLLDAAIFKENELADARRRRIRELAGDDEALRDRLMRGEEERHENNLRRIHEEFAERKRLEEEKAQREAERLAAQQFGNRLSEEAMEVERLRLSGLEEEADAMERQLEHQRNLEVIRTREGLSDTDRERLVRKEEELFRLRNEAAIQRPEELGSIGFGGGFADALLSRQVLGARGDDPQRAIKSNTDKILEQVRDAVESLREIGRNFTIGLV